jgi:hypothetical protein
MDNDEPKPQPRKAKKKAIEALGTSGFVKPGNRKRSALTPEPSGRAKKAHKTTSSQHVQETPSTKRMAYHNGLTESVIIYAPDMEAQITAEARGVTRKNVPLEAFDSTYLCGFSTKARPNLTVKSVMDMGKGSWEEKQFWGRLRKTLSIKVRCSGCAFIYLSVLC